MRELPDSYSAQLALVLAGWLLFVGSLAAFFRSWLVFLLFPFPAFAFAWMLWNEQRLKSAHRAFPGLKSGLKIHFFVTVPLLIAIRLILSVSKSVTKPDEWRLMLAMSFGLAWVLVILYAFGIVSRKTAIPKGGKAQQDTGIGEQAGGAGGPAL